MWRATDELMGFVRRFGFYGEFTRHIGFFHDVYTDIPILKTLQLRGYTASS
jgi:hypothetical protein